MKILAGKYKGISIYTSKNTDFRPTQSKVRKSLFDILGDLSGLKVIDLFSGTGILGFEAASRGAAQVDFVEQDRNRVKYLVQNIKKFDERDFTVHRSDAKRFIMNNSDLFDLILADPPYGQKDLNLLVAECKNKLNSGGRLVLETSVKDAIVESDRDRIFGNTRLSFWSK